MTPQHLRLSAFALVLLIAPCMEATSAHTWVAGNGNDANPCSVPQPCLTFQAAHNATTAGGIISVLSPGDFGAVTISKAITIDGGAIRGTITFTGSEGIYVNAGTSDTVILRHLAVNGLNTGSDAVYASTARYLIIEDCDLENFTDIGIGINSLTNPINVTVKSTRIIGGLLGVRTFQTSNSVQLYIISMRNMVISGASSAAVFSRNGLLEISDSLITQSGIGLECDTSASINIVNSVISYNTTDLLAYTPGWIYASNNNTFFGNNGTGGGGPSPAVVLRSNAPLSADKPRPHK